MAPKLKFSITSLERVEAPLTLKAYVYCTFAAFAGVLFGYDTGYINSVLGMAATKKIYGHPVPLSVDPSGYSLHTWEKSLIVSILSAGTFCGAIISGWFADRIGRRATILGPGCVVFALGVVIEIAVTSTAGLCVGRFVAGLGGGCVSAIIIIYMSEIAPRKVRGAIISSYQFAITIGIMLASCVAYSTENRIDTGAFRIPIGIQFLWVLILGIGLLLLPESPRYLVMKNRLAEAASALARIRGQPNSSEYIEDELAEIVANQGFESRMGEVTWRDCFSGSMLNAQSNIRKVFLGTAIQMFQQWTGINFIFYFNTTFFQQIHIEQNAFLISMVTTIVNMVCTPFSFYAIEKFGRRPLLVWGAVAMAICEFIIAIVGTADGSSVAANYCLIAFMCVYIFFFAATWGPATWVVTGEIFHLPLRSKGVALSTASNWFWNCVIAIITPYIVDPAYGNLGDRVFFIWGSTCCCSALFAWCLIPETKGLTLEQVDQMMEQVPAHRSGNWRPEDTFAPDFGFRSPPGTPAGGSPRVEHFQYAEPPKMESFIDR